MRQYIEYQSSYVGVALQSHWSLFRHNLVRAAKWELPLMWDFQLEQYARWWAGERKADCKLEHSFPEDGFKLGENIYWGSDLDPPVLFVI